MYNEQPDAKIPQFDGNDSLDNNEVIEVTSNISRDIRTRVAQFELNQAKQTAGIYRDALIQDFKVVHKDQDKNINIECSSGFYAQVAKPTICSLSQDYIPPILGFSIICTDITKNIDGSGHEYNITMFFKVCQDNGNSRKVTIHAHNSKRLVQIQGGATMPDGMTAALWFSQNVLIGKFQVLAKARSYNISRFNEAISSMPAPPSGSSKTKCASCDVLFDSRSKPIYCAQCVRWFHKTNCHRGHRCTRYFPLPPNLSQGPASPAAAPPPLSTSASAVTSAVTTPPTVTTPSTLSRRIPLSSSPTQPATSSSSTTSLTTSLLVNAVAASSIARVSSIPTTSLDPYALPYEPPLPPPPPNVRKPRNTQNVSNFTPEKAELESLKIELGYARTKIVDLQTKNKDLEQTNKIYSQKLNLLEGKRMDSMHEKYFPSTFSSSDSCSNQFSLDCPCKMRDQISNNAAALKSLDLKLSECLEKLTKESSSFPTIIPSDDVQVMSACHSSPTAAPIGSPLSTPPLNPQTVHLVNNDVSPEFVFKDVVFSSRHTNDSANTDSTPSAVTVDAPEEPEAPPETDSESDYDFSASFEVPSESPKVHLN